MINLYYVYIESSQNEIITLIYKTVKEYKKENDENLINDLNKVLLLISSDIKEIDKIYCEKITEETDTDILYHYEDALCTFVYFDSDFYSFFVRKYFEPNYRLLNFLNEKKKMKVFICSQSKELSNKVLLSRISSYYGIDNYDHSFSSIDNLTYIFENGINNSEDEYLILTENISVKEIEKLYNLTYKYKNVDIIIKSETQLYKISKSPGEIVLKKVYV